MRLTNATWIAAVLVAASAGFALWAWMMLPPGAGVPVDYLGLDGVRHHGASRSLLWLIPDISGFIAVAMTFAPGFGGRSQLERAAKVFDIVLIGVPGLLLVVQAALVGRAMDPDFNVLRPVAIATGVLLLTVGNALGKAQRNGLIGIRTPWTLADSTVWDKTHRFTGRGLALSGLALVVLGLAVHEAVVLGLAIGACTAVPMLAGALRSRSLYRALPRA